MNHRRLIVGLGNPGKEYEGTRHNVGFHLLEVFAAKHRLEFRRKEKFQAKMAEGAIDGTPVTLLMPLTFMNLSGEAISAFLRMQEVELANILVIVDDVAIEFGQLRIKPDGTSGGHNGLKSVEENLGTIRFPRLRIGVGDEREGDLADYVLAKFSPEEKKLLPEILERAVRSIEIWIEKGITRAMDTTNRRPSNPSNGEDHDKS